MKQVRKADDREFYYCVEIDKDGNEEIIGEADTLEALQNELKLDKRLKVYLDSEISGSKTPEE